MGVLKNFELTLNVGHGIQMESTQIKWLRKLLAFGRVTTRKSRPKNRAQTKSSLQTKSEENP